MQIPFTVDWYKAKLDSTDSRSRIRAIRALGKHANVEIANIFLLPKLNDRDYEVRVAAMNTLKTLTTILSFSRLIEFSDMKISWRVRQDIIELAKETQSTEKLILLQAYKKLRTTVNGLVDKAKPSDEYIFSNIQIALNYALNGLDFEVVYTPRTYKSGPVRIPYQLIDKQETQSNYGSGNPGWDSISETYEYEDGHVETLSYEGMGVPYIESPPARYKEGLVLDQPERFEIRCLERNE